jgi:hypothetical protein
VPPLHGEALGRLHDRVTRRREYVHKFSVSQTPSHKSLHNLVEVSLWTYCLDPKTNTHLILWIEFQDWDLGLCSSTNKSLARRYFLLWRSAQRPCSPKYRRQIDLVERHTVMILVSMIPIFFQTSTPLATARFTTYTGGTSTQAFHNLLLQPRTNPFGYRV